VENLLDAPKQASRAAHRALADEITRLVCSEFVKGWELMHKHGWSAAALHIARVEAPPTRDHFAALQSNLFCSICFLRRPEHVFECRHSICDHCAKTYGDARLAEEYTYVIPQCYSCGTKSNLLVRLKPPTAGVRILAIDGGGTGGIVPLKFLESLQRSLGTACRVQDLFDLVLGTSSGEHLFNVFRTILTLL